MTDFASLFDIYKQAVFQKDLEAFVSIFDEKVRVFDMWQRWTYDGLPAWREMAAGWFTSMGTDRDVVTFEDIQIEETGDLAFASALVRFTAVSAEGKELRYLENRLTWVARKKVGVWKIIHEHTSGPIDFESMKVILRR
jgi:ketosteroid isomerase-like protein